MLELQTTFENAALSRNSFERKSVGRGNIVKRILEEEF
jgi:hypothetical protein